VFDAARQELGELVLESEKRLLASPAPAKNQPRGGWLTRLLHGKR